MFKFIKNIISVLVLIVVFYYFRAPLREVFVPAWYNAKALLFAPDACEEPIIYTLGTFDTKFNISQKYFLEAVAEAEAIWEEPSGIDLFTYEPENQELDTLRINLIHDYRQEATSTLADLGITVKETQASYDNLKSKYSALKVQYEKDKTTLNNRIEAFNQKNEAYEKEVSYWNKKGGAPEAEYKELQATQAELQREAGEL
jgi:hypothetical protein